MNKETSVWLSEVIKASKLEFSILKSVIPSEVYHATGRLKDWSMKDVYAHLTYWIEVFSHNINASINSTSKIDTNNYAKLNIETWSARNALTWDEVNAALDHAFIESQSLLENLSEEQLTDKTCLSIGGNTLISDYLYEFIEHPIGHWVSLYIKANDKSAALDCLTRVESSILNDNFSKWLKPVKSKIAKSRKRFA